MTALGVVCTWVASGVVAALLLRRCWRRSGALIVGGRAVLETEFTEPDEQAADDWMALADACQGVRDRNGFITAEIERHDFTLWTLEAGWTA